MLLDGDATSATSASRCTGHQDRLTEIVHLGVVGAYLREALVELFDEFQKPFWPEIRGALAPATIGSNLASGATNSLVVGSSLRLNASRRRAISTFASDIARAVSREDRCFHAKRCFSSKAAVSEPAQGPFSPA
jgi:hypothetical protein